MFQKNLIINPWIIVIMISILLGFVFTVYILQIRKGNRKSNKLLALFLFAITLLLFSNFVVLSNLFKVYPHLIGISFLLWYILPPTFYLYVKTGIYSNHKLKWLHILHYAPFIYMLIKLLPFYLLNAGVKLKWFENFMDAPRSLTGSAFFVIIYSFAYLLACIWLFIKFKKNYKSKFANTHFEHFDGIKRLILIYLIYKVLDLVALSASYLSVQSNFEITQFISICISIFIFVISYTLLAQPNMLLQLETEKVKYSTSSLSGFDLNNYALQLEKLMTEKKLFRDNEINLTKLSKELGISSHILSQVLNQHYNINFYEYINQFRIDEVKKQLLIKENQNLTIISIAFDAGFNSKSSFQKIFKKYVGKTPSTYMKENLK